MPLFGMARTLALTLALSNKAHSQVLDEPVDHRRRGSHSQSGAIIITKTHNMARRRSSTAHTRPPRIPDHRPYQSLLLLLLLGTMAIAVTVRPAPFKAAFLPVLTFPQRPGGARRYALPPSNQLVDTSLDDGTTTETFAELYGERLPTWLLTRAESLGFARPTMVQREALGAILDGEDVVIQAQTGTGKTLAFMLPLLAGIDASKQAVQAMVVVPSRELGLQVASVAKQLSAGRVYYRDEEVQVQDDDDDDDDEAGSSIATSITPTVNGTSNKILVMSLLEGSKNTRQKAWVLAEPPHVVIGNPLALSRLVEQGGIRYHQVKMVVIDEVDACLTRRETRAQLQALLGKYLSPSFLTSELEEEAAMAAKGGKEDEALLIPQGAMKEGGSGSGGNEARQLAPWKLVHRQTLFVSATIPQHNHFIKQCVQQKWTLRQPIHVQVTPGELMPPQLQHNYLVCPTKADKLAALRAFLRREQSKGRLHACAIFTANDQEAEDIAAGLTETDGVKEEEEEGSVKKRKGGLQALLNSDHIKRRAKVMDAFRAGESRVLVTTDFAARGLDVPRISHVAMYDIPADAETYLHRGGRAGRMGRAGSVTSLVSETEEFALLRLANSLKIEMKRLGVMRKAARGDGERKRGKR